MCNTCLVLCKEIVYTIRVCLILYIFPVFPFCFPLLFPQKIYTSIILHVYSLYNKALHQTIFHFFLLSHANTKYCTLYYFLARRYDDVWWCYYLYLCFGAYIVLYICFEINKNACKNVFWISWKWMSLDGKYTIYHPGGI